MKTVIKLLKFFGKIALSVYWLLIGTWGTLVSILFTLLFLGLAATTIFVVVGTKNPWWIPFAICMVGLSLAAAWHMGSSIGFFYVLARKELIGTWTKLT
jgi:hypothetical protein